MQTSSPISAVSPMTTPMAWSTKNLLPIFAAGWMSHPVRLMDLKLSSLALSNSPASQSLWASL